MLKSPLRNQSGVIFLTLAVILMLVMIFAIAINAKRAHDRQQQIRQVQTFTRHTSKTL